MWPFREKPQTKYTSVQYLSDREKEVVRALATQKLSKLSDGHDLAWLAKQVQDAVYEIGIPLSKAECVSLILDIKRKHNEI